MTTLKKTRQTRRAPTTRKNDIFAGPVGAFTGLIVLNAVSNTLNKGLKDTDRSLRNASTPEDIYLTKTGKPSVLVESVIDQYYFGTDTDMPPAQFMRQFNPKQRIVIDNNDPNDTIAYLLNDGGIVYYDRSDNDFHIGNDDLELQAHEEFSRDGYDVGPTQSLVRGTERIEIPESTRGLTQSQKRSIQREKYRSSNVAPEDIYLNIYGNPGPKASEAIREQKVNAPLGFLPIDRNTFAYIYDDGSVAYGKDIATEDGYVEELHDGDVELEQKVHEYYNIGPKTDPNIIASQFQSLSDAGMTDSYESVPIFKERDAIGGYEKETLDLFDDLSSKDENIEDIIERGFLDTREKIQILRDAGLHDDDIANQLDISEYDVTDIMERDLDTARIREFTARSRRYQPTEEEYNLLSRGSLNVEQESFIKNVDFLKSLGFNNNEIANQLNIDTEQLDAFTKYYKIDEEYDDNVIIINPERKTQTRNIVRGYLSVPPEDQYFQENNYDESISEHLYALRDNSAPEDQYFVSSFSDDDIFMEPYELPDKYLSKHINVNNRYIEFYRNLLNDNDTEDSLISEEEAKKNIADSTRKLNELLPEARRRGLSEKNIEQYGYEFSNDDDYDDYDNDNDDGLFDDNEFNNFLSDDEIKNLSNTNLGYKIRGISTDIDLEKEYIQHAQDNIYGSGLTSEEILQMSQGGHVKLSENSKEIQNIRRLESYLEKLVDEYSTRKLEGRGEDIDDNILLTEIQNQKNNIKSISKTIKDNLNNYSSDQVNKLVQNRSESIKELYDLVDQRKNQLKNDSTQAIDFENDVLGAINPIELERIHEKHSENIYDIQSLRERPYVSTLFIFSDDSLAYVQEKDDELTAYVIDSYEERDFINDFINTQDKMQEDTKTYFQKREMLDKLDRVYSSRIDNIDPIDFSTVTATERNLSSEGRQIEQQLRLQKELTGGSDYDDDYDDDLDLEAGDVSETDDELYNDDFDEPEPLDTEPRTSRPRLPSEDTDEEKIEYLQAMLNDISIRLEQEKNSEVPDSVFVRGLEREQSTISRRIQDLIESTAESEVFAAPLRETDPLVIKGLSNEQLSDKQREVALQIGDQKGLLYDIERNEPDTILDENHPQVERLFALEQLANIYVDEYRSRQTEETHRERQQEIDALDFSGGEIEKIATYEQINNIPDATKTRGLSRSERRALQRERMRQLRANTPPEDQYITNEEDKDEYDDEQYYSESILNNDEKRMYVDQVLVNTDEENKTLYDEYYKQLETLEESDYGGKNSYDINRTLEILKIIKNPNEVSISDKETIVYFDRFADITNYNNSTLEAGVDQILESIKSVGNRIASMPSSYSVKIKQEYLRHEDELYASLDDILEEYSRRNLNSDNIRNKINDFITIQNNSGTSRIRLEREPAYSEVTEESLLKNIEDVSKTRGLTRDQKRALQRERMRQQRLSASPEDQYFTENDNDETRRHEREILASPTDYYPVPKVSKDELTKLSDDEIEDNIFYELRNIEHIVTEIQDIKKDNISRETLSKLDNLYESSIVQKNNIYQLKDPEYFNSEIEKIKDDVYLPENIDKLHELHVKLLESKTNITLHSNERFDRKRLGIDLNRRMQASKISGEGLDIAPEDQYLTDTQDTNLFRKQKYNNNIDERKLSEKIRYGLNKKRDTENDTIISDVARGRLSQKLAQNERTKDSLNRQQILDDSNLANNGRGLFNNKRMKNKYSEMYMNYNESPAEQLAGTHNPENSILTHGVAAQARRSAVEQLV